MSIEKRLETQLELGSKLGKIPIRIFHDQKPTNFITPCRVWVGAKDNTGYGVMRAPKSFMGSKTGVVRVHRLAKFLEVHFPVKCQVDHLCRNRLCINPRHLKVIGPKTHGKLSKKDQINANT